ncbi:MAG: hypothetical protein ACTIM4_13560 [Marinomonas sp.]
MHIPKTAGTSFRHALDEFGGVCRDYGKKSQETTGLIQEKIYQGKDEFRAYESFMASDYEWLCGHFPVNKYLNWFSSRNIVVFVRDPIEQVISHYNHYVSYFGFKEDFTTFCNKPMAQNIQSKHAAGIPVELLGFVGVTEKYHDSLTLLNQQLQSSYAQRKSNVNPSKRMEAARLSMQEKEWLEERLAQDITLYEKANHLLETRKQLEEQGHEWCHGIANVNANKVLVGCAFYSNSDEAVEVDVLKNGKLLKQFSATGFYGQHPKAQFPRNRFIGFRIPLAKNITAEDTLEVVVRSTQQRISLYR